MGMDYSIYADKQTLCRDNFPEELSNFFEQYGGYGEMSEVAQVATILNIDLTCFQHYACDTKDNQKGKQYWQPIEQFSAIVTGFIKRIQQQPNYHEFVKHGLDRHLMLQETEEMLTNLVQSDAYRYPPDYAYLSSGRLVEDLQKLEAVLTCFQKTGVQKIKLVYR